MSDDGAEPDRPPVTVFLNYASEDRQAARRIGDALPAYGIEIWYDESELGGGDAYPAADADPAKIATEVDSNAPSTQEPRPHRPAAVHR